MLAVLCDLGIPPGNLLVLTSVVELVGSLVQLPIIDSEMDQAESKGYGFSFVSKEIRLSMNVMGL